MAKTIRSSALAIIYIIAALSITITSCNNSDDEPQDVPDNIPPPKTMGYSITRIYPHDTSAYTQGLTFYKGELLEGTGEYDSKSRLRKVDINTGKPIQEIVLDSIYFGEGITVLRDTIYQLTYKEKVVFAYTYKNFKKVKQFSINTEGWGLTTDGKYLIATDGGSNLYFYDPTTFALIRTQTVMESGKPSYNLNELEYVDGLIYANQYERPYILVIDPASGNVLSKCDISQIWNTVRAKDPRVNVPNGIAYDSTSKKMYITGKWWPELYEVEFSK